MKITVDADLCSGQGRCYALSPSLFSSDDEGFCAQRGTSFDVADDQSTAGELAIGSCPEGAIALSAK